MAAEGTGMCDSEEISVKRPSVKETDEDLLAEQEKFLSSRPAALASIVKKKIEETKATLSKINENDDQIGDDKRFSILADIVERDVNKLKVEAPNITSITSGFPVVPKLTKAQLQCSSKRSLFATQLANKKQKVNLMKENGSKNIENKFGEASFVVENPTLAKPIHESNLQTLSVMSEADLLQEQQQLTQLLLSSEKGADLLDFLKSRRGNRLKSTESNVLEPVIRPQTEIDISKFGDLPLNVDEMKKYPRMDKVEADKLQWMAKMPETNCLKSESGLLTARFDFDGKLVSRNAPIPSHEGLYHHGSEPEAPGYSLDELFQLIRSTHIQQRVLGLRTLSKIFLNAKVGFFDVCLVKPLIPQCLDAGVVILLRWALDDSIQASIEAALSGLCALISDREDEEALTRVLCWKDGFYFPFLKGEETEKEIETSDIELVKSDVIKGLVRMDLLPRLRYILEKYSLSSPAISSIFGILTRIARHSLESASLIVHDTRLMTLIVNNFLPKDYSNLDVVSSVPAYNAPSYEAVHLMRVLVCCGRHLACTLDHSFQLVEVILDYLTLDLNFREVKSGNANTLKLVVESLYLWKCLLQYGVGGQKFLDFFPCVIEFLPRFEKLSLENCHSFDSRFCSGLLNVLETALCLQLASTSDGEKAIETWNLLRPVVKVVNSVVRKWLWQLTQLNGVSDCALDVVGCGLNFLATFYKGAIHQSQTPVMIHLDEIEELCTAFLFPFWQSPTCTSLLSRLENFSCLLDETPAGNRRTVPCLPCVGAVKWTGKTSRAIDVDSPYHCLTAFLNLIVSCHSLNQALDERLTLAILTNEKLVQYLNAISHSRVKNCHNENIDWFSRVEYRFIYFVINLAVLKAHQLEDASVIYRASCALLRHLLVGDEFLLMFLFRRVMFCSDFFTRDVSETMADLSLRETNLPLATGQTTNVSHTRLVSSAIDSLPAQRWVYLSALGYLFTTLQSARCDETKCIQSMGIVDGLRLALGSAWIFLPFSSLYSQISNKQSEDETTLSVTQCLQHAYLFLRAHPSHIDVDVYFSYLATVFVLRSDLFMDPTIHSYLLAILVRLFNDTRWPNCRLKDYPLKKQNSFHDFYLQLLAQFESVSYSDALFSLFVLVPVQQQFDVKFRTDLWTNRSVILRCLTISLDQVPVPLDKYLFPLEKDDALIVSYFQALINGIVGRRTPFLYLIAVHHVHNYLFIDAESMTEAKIRIVKSFVRIKIENLLTHLTRYCKPNAAAPLGFELLDEIPAQVQTMLEKCMKSM